MKQSHLQPRIVICENVWPERRITISEIFPRTNLMTVYDVYELRDI